MNISPIKIKHEIGDYKGLIGASMAGACLGLSTYKSKYDIYKLFIGEKQEVTPELQEVFEMGHELEEFIARQVERIYKLKCRRSNFAYVCPTLHKLICHPDRIITGKSDGKVIGLEIKSSSVYDNDRWGEPWSDKIPMDYLIQCHCYIICGVCDEVWLARFSNNRLTIYVVRKNEALEEKIVKGVANFIEKVESGWIPPIEDVKKAKEVFNRDTSGDIEADEEIERTVEELEKAKAEESEAKKRKEILQAKVVSYMKDKKTLVNRLGKVLCKYVKVTQSRIDSKLLEAEMPDIYKKYSKESSYMKLT